MSNSAPLPEISWHNLQIIIQKHFQSGMLISDIAEVIDKLYALSNGRRDTDLKRQISDQTYFNAVNYLHWLQKHGKKAFPPKYNEKLARIVNGIEVDLIATLCALQPVIDQFQKVTQNEELRQLFEEYDESEFLDWVSRQYFNLKKAQKLIETVKETLQEN